MPWRRRGSGCTAPCLNLGCRCRWPVSLTSRPLYSRGMSPGYPLDKKVCESKSRSGRGGEGKDSCLTQLQEVYCYQQVTWLPNSRDGSIKYWPAGRDLNYFFFYFFNMASHSTHCNIWFHFPEQLYVCIYIISQHIAIGPLCQFRGELSHRLSVAWLGGTRPHKMLCSTVAARGAETWLIDTRVWKEVSEVHRLKVFENWVLGRISGPTTHKMAQ